MSFILLVGDRHSGKTSTCQRLAELLHARGLPPAGVVAPAVHRAGRCVGYNVVDLATGRTTLLATTDGLGVEQVGQFGFLAEGLALGRAVLETAAETPHGLVIVDEVGPLELTGGGWAKQLDRLIHRPGLALFTIRRGFAAAAARRWKVPAWGIYKLAKGSDKVIAAVIKLVETDRG